MADDDRPGARGPEVAPAVKGWLAAEPLDDVTRRRLVSIALRESAPPESATRPSRAWRWIAAAAALVVVAIGTLAVVTAEGGKDDQVATRPERSSVGVEPAAPKAAAGSPVVVGDFGDLDQPANLGRLRSALSAATPPTAADASGSQSTAAGAAGGALSSQQGCLAGVVGTVVAQGSGTIDGQPIVVYLIRGGDGTTSVDAFVSGTCEVRHLP